ncbi:MAG: GWxTD domain-containing protein, partial [Cyclobacteriaceae bacterium]|nr:GWxTD domain-containing protein [Cyclobacteriaceae bacterium]
KFIHIALLILISISAKSQNFVSEIDFSSSYKLFKKINMNYDLIMSDEGPYISLVFDINIPDSLLIFRYLTFDSFESPYKDDLWKILEVECESEQCKATIDKSLLKGVFWVQVINSYTGESHLFNGITDINEGIYIKNIKDEVILKDYLITHEKYRISLKEKRKQLYVFRYKENFLPSDPPMGRINAVSPSMEPDSVFNYSPEDEISFSQPGLYLFLTDTIKFTGRAWLVVDNQFPAVNTLYRMRDCMTYLASEKEWGQLSKTDLTKKEFDQIWVKASGGTDNAGNMIRTYFRRIRTANELFTTYKPGWKTDKGMISIIFGLPDEVSKNNNEEIWSYKAGLSHGNITFVFKYVPSVFSRNHFALERNKNYKFDWFSSVERMRTGKEID